MSPRHPAGPTRAGNRGRAEHAVRLLTTLLLAAAPLARAQPPTVDVVENPRDPSCQASGSRARDASGTTHTLEFPVAWQRADAQPIAIDADYEIGADVDLLGVRTRQTRCTCADPPPAAAPTPP